MNTSSKALLFAVLLIMGVTGVVFLMNAGGEPPPQFGTTEVEPASDPETVAPDALVSAAPNGGAGAEAAPYERQEVDPGSNGAEYAQGARGLVLDPAGHPLPHTKVYLMEGGGMNLLQQMMLVNKGALIPPVARTETDETGQFSLGVARPDPEKRYEIRVISDRFVDGQVPNIHIAKGEWYDAGKIQLERGTLLYGRVTIEGSGGLPVPNARVMVKPLNFVPAISPTPGREEGIVVAADHAGSFRMENAPPGVVTISAVAPGYAKIEKTNITIAQNGDNQVLFELPQGVSIAGRVTDASETPVPNAKIKVTAISSKTPVHTETRSDERGHFEAIGLVQGQYMLTAIAPGFVPPNPLKPIQAGDQNVHIVLESQGSARLVVYDKNNALMTRYRVEIKKYIKAQDQISASMVPPKQARPGRDGVFVMDGLNPDTYVFQVEAEGHAKAFSQPFDVTLGAEPPLVEVRLNEGGKLEGVVLDSHGKPLPGVHVTTLPNDLDDNPFTEMFGGIIPYKVTRTGTRTDANGAYRIQLLNPGIYQLKFTHPEHYDLSIKDHEVVANQTTTVAPVTMHTGTAVSGAVRVDGQPAGQVKVTITAMTDPKVTNPSLFNCSAITDNEGKFAMSKRVPPGSYHVMAARQTLANPLLQIADFHKTKQEITLGQGQSTYFLTINIASQ